MGHKYETTTPRYWHGTYVHASPENPAVVELEEGDIPDAGLTPVGNAPSPRGRLKPHFAQRPDAAEVFGKTKDGEKDAAAKAAKEADEKKHEKHGKHAAGKESL